MGPSLLLFLSQRTAEDTRIDITYQDEKTFLVQITEL